MSDDATTESPRERGRDLSQRAALVALAVLIALAGVMRVWYVLSQPMPPVVADAAGYDASAQRLLDTGTYAYPFGVFDTQSWDISAQSLRTFYGKPPNAYTVPGYVWFVAGVYRVSGRGPERFAAVRVAQALVSLLLLAIVYALARRAGARRWGAVLAVVLAAAYPPFTWATGHILTETLYTVLFAASALAVVIAVEKPSFQRFAVAGLVAGLAAIVRPVGLLWPAVAVAYLLFSRKHGWRAALITGAALALGALIVIGPWTVRNYVVYGRFVPLTTSGGNALAASTTEKYERTGKPDAEYPDRFMADDYALGSFWTAIGQERLAAKLRTDPAGFVAVRARIAYSAIAGVWPTAPAGLAGRVAIWMHKLLLALFVAGIVVRRRAPPAWLLASVPLYYVAVHAVTLITTRYLLPAMPFVIVLAAAAVEGLVAWGSARRVGTIFTAR